MKLSGTSPLYQGVIVMDKDRRTFFRDLGAKAAGIAAASVPPAISQIDFTTEFKKFSDSMNDKFDDAVASFGKGYDQLSNRLDAAALTQTWQQAQIHLIFLLLLISFAIDGGMTLTWLITP
jgi:hypothetical protein